MTVAEGTKLETMLGNSVGNRDGNTVPGIGEPLASGTSEGNSSDVAAVPVGTTGAVPVPTMLVEFPPGTGNGTPELE
jgi:hypothetical protein